MRLLLEAGAEVEHQNENGHTPLMEAASCGHVGGCGFTSSSFPPFSFFPSLLSPLNKGHFGANSFVPCREVVPISEVK